MAFTRLGKVADIPEGDGKMFDLGDRWIGVFKVDGDLFAVDDICSHQEAFLHAGMLEGHSIECDAHGAPLRYSQWPGRTGTRRPSHRHLRCPSSGR